MGINIFSNASRFSNVAQNPKALAVFLSVASNETRNYDQLVEDTRLDLAIVAPLVRELENGNFIETNPGPLSNKFKLAFNGQLFAEQLRTMYPEVKELFGGRDLIKPITIRKLI